MCFRGCFTSVGGGHAPVQTQELWMKQNINH